MEIEAKYTASSPELLASLQKASEIANFRVTDRNERRITDRYRDTVERDLFHHGYAHRLRETDGCFRATLKGLGGADGAIHRREEWEFDLDAVDTPPCDWPESPARDIVLSLTSDRPLHDLFTIRQRRINRSIMDGERHVACLSLDTVETVLGDRIVPSLEVEIEIEEDGTIDDLNAVGREMAKMGLQPESRSKFERAMREADRAAPRTSRRLRAVSGSTFRIWLRRRRNGVLGLFRLRARPAAIFPTGPTGSAPIGPISPASPDPASLSVVPANSEVAVDPQPTGTVEPPAKADSPTPPRSQDYPFPMTEPIEDAPPTGIPSSETPSTPIPPANTPEALPAPLPSIPSAAAAGPRQPDDSFPPAQDDGEMIPGQATQAEPEPADHGEPENGSASDRKKKKSVGVSGEDTLCMAGTKVLQFHFRRFLDNESGTIEGADIEALHDMRVATRRMRAAVRVFGPSLPKQWVPRLNEDLRATGRALGPVRDLDVLLEKARRFHEKQPSGAGIEPLLEQWSLDRETARREMLSYLTSVRYVRFRLKFQAILFGDFQPVEEEPPSTPPKPRQVRHCVPALVWARYGRVRAYETALEGADISTLHALRIDCKRLRYAMEFFQEVLDDPIESLIAEVTEIQDVLGDLHDSDVAVHLLHRMIEEGRERHGTKKQEDFEGEEGFRRYLEHHAREIVVKRGEFAVLWERVAGAEFRERLGEALARL